MTALRNLFLISLLGGCTVQVLAQQTPLCDCFRVADEQRALKAYSSTKAQAVVDSFCRLFQHPAKIYPKPYACTELLYAKICETGERKYVFYNESFMSGLFSQTKWGDRFLLAHEIAHHLLGHTERAYRLGKVLRQPNGPLDPLYSKRLEKSGKEKPVPIPERHLHELEADALGLWMVVKQRATRKDMQAIFDALPKLLSVYEPYNPNTDTESHPSLFVREKLIERYWDKFENQRMDRRYAGISGGDSYRGLEKDTEEFYAFQLLNASQEQQMRFNQVEHNIRDSLSRRSRFSIDVIVGGMLQLPVLRRNTDPVAATQAHSLAGGIRLNAGPWYKANRVETDLKIAASSFTTQAQLPDGLRTIEQFNTTYLYVQPRYVRSWLNRLARYTYRASGPMLTAGLSVNIPLHFSYVNYAATTYRMPTQRVGIAPTIGVGYGLSNWLSSNGHFRVWLMYQPQPVVLAVETPEDVSARLHTVSLDFSFRFW